MGVARYLRSAWAALPGWARWVLAVYLTGFADGTAAHARDLARAGFHAYSGFPQVPLRVFFTSLVLLDPLVVVLATAPAMLRPQRSCGIHRRIPGLIPHANSGRVRPDHVRVQCYDRDGGTAEFSRQLG